LFPRPLCKFGAADALRETQIILNLWATGSLPAHGVALDQYGLQALGGAIDGGAEACRTNAIDRQIILLERGISEPTQFFEYSANCRMLNAGTIGEFAHGQSLIVAPRQLRLAACLLVTGEIDPLERHVAAMQKIADIVASR